MTRAASLVALTVAPLAWGLLTWVTTRRLDALPPVSPPWWVLLWNLRLLALLPLWLWVWRREPEREGRRRLLAVFPWALLAVAYAAALAAIPLHRTRFAMTIAFGAVVSPVVEELLSRHLLAPWRSAPLARYAAVAGLSSLSFALMHWGFHGDTVFTWTASQHLARLADHAIFGVALCAVYRLTGSSAVTVALHAAMNARAIAPH